MTERREFIETLRSARQTMQDNEKAHKAYIKARDERNTAFCVFYNKFGFRAAQEAKKEAEA